MRVPMTETPTEIHGNLPNVRPEAPDYQDFRNRQTVALGNAAQGLGGEIAQLGLQIQDENNKAIVQSKILELQNKRNTLTHDPEVGYKNLLGKNALERPDNMNLSDEYVGQLDHAAAEASQGLKNQAQQELFMQAYGQMRNSFSAETQNHVRQQNQQFQLDTADATTAINLRSFVMADNPEDRAVYNNEVMQAISRKGQLLGWSSEQMVNEYRKNMGGAVQTAAASMMDAGDWDGADLLLQTHKDAMDADSYTKLARDIDNGRAEQQGQMIGEAIENDGIYTENVTGNAAITQTVNKIIGNEGTGKNPHSTSIGVGQFINSTWKGLLQEFHPELIKGKLDKEIMALKLNKTLAREMVYRYVQKNAKRLSAAGLPVTPGNLRLSHFADGTRAALILKAPANTPVSKFFSKEEITANKFLIGMTTGQLVAWANKQMGGTKTIVAKTESEKMQALANIKDKRVQKAAMQQAGIRRQINDQRKREYEAALDNQTMSIIAQNGGDYTKVPPSLRNQYDPKKWLAVQNFGDSVRNQNEEELFNKNKFAYFELLYHPDKLGALPRSEVEAMALSFGLEKNRALVNAYDQYHKSPDKTKSPPAISANVANSIAKMYGLPAANKSNPDQAEKRFALQENVSAIQQQFYDQNKRWPTDEELFTRARKLQAQKIVTEKGWLWDTETPVMLLTKEQRQAQAKK